VGETPDQFVDRLKRYLDKWREMAGYKDNYDDLKDMIGRNQYYIMCDKSLQTFLKEKGKLNLKDMCKASNDYYDAHGYPTDNPEHKDKYHSINKPFNNHKSHNGPNNQAHLHKQCTVVTVALIITTQVSAENHAQVKVALITLILSVSYATKLVTDEISVK